MLPTNLKSFFQRKGAEKNLVGAESWVKIDCSLEGPGKISASLRALCAFALKKFQLLVPV